MKYVIIKHKGLETSILFPNWLPHDFFKNHNPVRAGFCRIRPLNNLADDTCYEVYGKSVGLGLNSLPADGIKIKRQMEAGT